MADAPDSKSGDGNIVWVQVPPPAPKIRTLETSVSDFFMAIFDYDIMKSKRILL